MNRYVYIYAADPEGFASKVKEKMQKGYHVVPRTQIAVYRPIATGSDCSSTSKEGLFAVELEKN